MLLLDVSNNHGKGTRELCDQAVEYGGLLVDLLLGHQANPHPSAPGSHKCSQNSAKPSSQEQSTEGDPAKAPKLYIPFLLPSDIMFNGFNGLWLNELVCCE